MNETKPITISLKPKEQDLVEKLKEAGHFYTTSDMIRSALWTLADKILDVNTLTSVKGEEDDEN